VRDGGGWHLEHDPAAGHVLADGRTDGGLCKRPIGHRTGNGSDWEEASGTFGQVAVMGVRVRRLSTAGMAWHGMKGEGQAWGREG
jgi:hypothetical protein